MTRMTGALLAAIVGSVIAYLWWGSQPQASAAGSRGTVIFHNNPIAGEGA